MSSITGVLTESPYLEVDGRSGMGIDIESGWCRVGGGPGMIWMESGIYSPE
jgi:hypothetical protein